MITFKTTKAISPRALQILFQRNEWSDWWSLADIKWYLSHCLFAVSAWEGRNLVGIGVLTGDGRIAVNLDKLLVDVRYRGQGICKELIRRAVEKAESLRPFYFQTDVYQKSTERIYRRFGFRKNRGTWLLIHDPTDKKWKPRAISARKKRKQRTANRKTHTKR